jgi:hypothetical protein
MLEWATADSSALLLMTVILTRYATMTHIFPCVWLGSVSAIPIAWEATGHVRMATAFNQPPLDSLPLS